MKLLQKPDLRLSALLFAAMAALWGCGPSAPEKGNAPASPPAAAGSASGTATTPATGKHIRAAIVLQTGGVDDRSFNAAAVSGLKRAQQELGLSDSDVKYVESKDASDYKTNLTTFASQNYDLVFAVGYSLAQPLSEVAPQFPNVHFAIVDAPAPDSPNCLGLVFREEQGAYLAGYLAASVSKTKNIGYIGGQKIPVMDKMIAGYEAGAKTANPAVTVTVTFTGDWSDESKGRSQAEQQFGNGVDIILQGAGKSGLGVIEAARAKGAGVYVIGTDQDQDDLAPGRVLTTMIKRTDFAVFDTIRRAKEGQFDRGTRVYGVAEQGISLSDMRHTKQNVSPDVLKNLNVLKQLIAEGNLTPPTNPKDVPAFQPPKLP